MFKEEPTPVLLKLFHKTEREGRQINIVDKASVTTISNREEQQPRAIDKFTNEHRHTIS